MFCFHLCWNKIMGSHREWRKIAKRERRRRIRTRLAREHDIKQSDSCLIQNWLKEQEVLENFEREQIEKSNREENEKWVQAERASLEQWKKLQEKLEAIQKEHLVQQERQKMELELEQKRKADEEKRLKEVEKENIEKQTMFLEKLEQYISGGATEPPEELMTYHETKPSCEICPFFSKTACCRFGDQCSRNHQYPGISNVLLAPNFYVHFGLENANFNEYDTDVMLEYEDNDTYLEFKNFFYDVLPEFQKFGKITQFKVCNNYEKHLRGNTYVEFEELRCSVAAYRALHSRWYGGRQLSLRFCRVDSWKNAICGLQSRRRCPKGRSCNFLHVFRNPENMFNTSYNRRFPESATHSRSWRWSESPEVELHSEKSRKKRRSNSSERNRKDREKRKHEDKKRSSRRRSERRKSDD